MLFSPFFLLISFLPFALVACFSPHLPTGLIPRTLGPFNVSILLNGWICLHGVLDRLLVDFRTHVKSVHFHVIHLTISLHREAAPQVQPHGLRSAVSSFIGFVIGLNALKVSLELEEIV